MERAIAPGAIHKGRRQKICNLRSPAPGAMADLTHKTSPFRPTPSPHPPQCGRPISMVPRVIFTSMSANSQNGPREAGAMSGGRTLSLIAFSKVACSLESYAPNSTKRLDRHRVPLPSIPLAAIQKCHLFCRRRPTSAAFQKRFEACSLARWPR